jgi:hypothetical protein
MIVKKAMLFPLLFLLFLNGCATVGQSTGNSMADAANGLIETKHNIIAAAKTMDVLCHQSVVQPGPCMATKSLYENEVQKSYKAASDALILGIASNSLDDYNVKNQALLNSLSSLTTLIQTFQGGKP